MTASIKSRINGIKKDRAHGAGWLTSQAVQILEEAASASTAGSTAAFIKEIGQVAAWLMDARPDMVSIPNYVIEFKEELDGALASSKSADNLKKRAAAIARKLKTYNEDTSVRSARYAARLIGQRSIVMTCSYSSIVCQTLETARQKGIDFKVLAAESLNSKIYYGNIMLERLKKSGIAGRTFPDNHVAWYTARANTIILGADAVSLQGWIINGVPSYSLALTASRKNVPVYAVCQSAKIDARGFLAGLRAPEPGFEMVPLDLIKGVVTECGILQTDDIFKMTIDDIFRGPRARSR
ncbi:MAG: hypothetical protein JXA01_04150 [Dehalococcoidia bacterium]|nr:hypothetical protein [Dehalococcoidia bacterium]